MAVIPSRIVTSITGTRRKLGTKRKQRKRKRSRHIADIRVSASYLGEGGSIGRVVQCVVSEEKRHFGARDASLYSKNIMPQEDSSIRGTF